MRDYKKGIAELIKRSGKTQKQLAIESGISEFVICAAKTGRRKLRLIEAVSICEACGYTVNYLVRLSEIKE